ncbi:MAG: hydrogenase maturation protease [Fibrobacterota bacterium]
MKPDLLLGIGNILMGDDGAGVRAVEWLRANADPLPSGTELLDGGTAGHDLLPLLQGRERIVIIDAAVTNDAPGTVRLFHPHELTGNSNPFSLHQAGILEVLKLLSLTGHTPEVRLITITAGEFGGELRLSLSPAVERAVPDAARRAIKLLKTPSELINQG